MLTYKGVVPLPWDPSMPQHHKAEDQGINIYYDTRNRQIRYATYEDASTIVIEQYESGFVERYFWSQDFRNYHCPLRTVSFLQ